MNQETKEILNIDEINTLKGLAMVESLGMTDFEISEKIKKLQDESITSEIHLALLFLQCLSAFRSRLALISLEKSIAKKLDSFLDSYNFDEVYTLISSYRFGKEYGDYLIEQKIKFLVRQNRKSYETLIILYSKLFGGGL